MVYVVDFKCGSNSISTDGEFIAGHVVSVAWLAVFGTAINSPTLAEYMQYCYVYVY